MKKAIMRGFAAILLVALVISGALNALAFNRQLTNEAEENLRALAMSFSSVYDPAGDSDAQARAFSSSCGGLRVTITDSQGVVLGDSKADFKTMRNHMDSPEFIQAKASGFGSDIRSSQTIGLSLVYFAVKTAGGSYVRVAREVSSIAGSLLSVVPAMVISLVFALILAVVITNRFSSRVLKPIIKMNDSLISVKDGGVTLDPGSYHYDELVALAGRINLISDDLSRHIQGIKLEKDKLNYILDNVREGFMLLDEKRNVLLINNTACVYLGCPRSVAGESVYRATRNSAFLAEAEKALVTGEERRMDLEADGRTVEAVFTRTSEESLFSAAVIITMKDVTDSRDAAKIKRDFFSNASHELKTPITSIKGSAELLCSGMEISPQQQKELLGRIGVEAQRMNQLVSDIIMINRMESERVESDRESVDMSLLTAECVDEVRPMAERDGIRIEVSLEPVAIKCLRKDLRELISNLLVNAVKYNQPGGRVEISLRKERGEAVFSVRNDGEPIPPEQQPRVFERFYRVDSGRSRAVGGTGLGLAIVKHVADSMEGSVTLTSDSREGTRFTVRLPLKG